MCTLGGINSDEYHISVFKAFVEEEKKTDNKCKNLINTINLHF